MIMSIWRRKWFSLPPNVPIFLSIAALPLVLTGAWAQKSDATLDRLATVHLFAFGGVGFANVVSQGEKDFYEVVSRSSAVTEFEKLVATGSPEAKCYALVGLRKLDAVEFKALSSSLRLSNARVTTMRGCIMSHQSLGALVQLIQAGQYPG